MRRMMVPRHIGTGHAARHINQTLEEIEAVPLWQDGDTDEIETEAGTRSSVWPVPMSWVRVHDRNCACMQPFF